MIVDELGSADEVEPARLSTSCGAYSGLGRLHSLERDTRWSTRYLAVRAAGALVGVLPLYGLLVDAWPDPGYDLGRLLGVPGSGRDWLLVGGRTDHSASFLRADRAPANVVEQAAGEAGRAAATIARAEGRRLAAPFVNPFERTYLAATFLEQPQEHVATQEARLPVVGDGESDYLASLRSSQRSVVRRDWAARERLGFRTCVRGWAEVMEYAPALVADVALGHGKPEHAKLVRARLETWLANPEVETVAFEVRAGEAVVAVALAWQWRDLLQLYEVGLPPKGTPGRHVAYVESMIYAPLRHAARTGCTELTLAMESTHPKRVRGARLHEVTILYEPDGLS